MLGVCDFQAGHFIPGRAARHNHTYEHLRAPLINYSIAGIPSRLQNT